MNFETGQWYFHKCTYGDKIFLVLKTTEYDLIILNEGGKASKHPITFFGNCIGGTNIKL